MQRDERRSFVSPYVVNAALARALGLDPAQVTDFTLRCRAGELPRLTVRYLPNKGQAGDLVTELSRRNFNLVPQPEPTPPPDPCAGCVRGGVCVGCGGRAMSPELLRLYGTTA